MVIKIISFTGKSGEITPEIMEKLAIFSNNFIESKNEIINKTTISIILTYFGSLIVLMMVIVVPSMNISNVADVISQIDEIELDDTITQMNMVLLIIVSFSSMTLTSKIRYGTIKHSMNSGVVLIIIGVILYYDKIIGINLS